MDSILTIVNVSFVAAIIFIIETIKKILHDQGKILSSNTWKIIVLLWGIPAGFIVQVVEGWPDGPVSVIIANIIVKCFIYSAAASYLYQTGKMAIEKIKGETK